MSRNRMWFPAYESQFMIHYSCDRCQRLIETEDEIRYVVRLEIQAQMGDDVFANKDEENDHLLEIHEIIERQIDEQGSAVGDEVYRRKRFDLCSQCHQAYLQNPLGLDVSKPVGFSQN